MGTRETLTRYFLEGVSAAHPTNILPADLVFEPVPGKTIVLGCGKAAAAMAAALRRQLVGLVEGCVVTRHGHGVGEALAGIDVIEAGHPVPDVHGLEASGRIMDLARAAGAGDRVVFLISGGGSSLLCAPAPGLSLEEKRQITDHLVRSGAPIEDINCVRRHLSQVKGGRLAAAAGARGAELITLAISDVRGDDIGLIASGPTVPAAFEPARAIAILELSGWPVSAGLSEIVHGNRPPVVPPHDRRILATNRQSLDAVCKTAAADGWSIFGLGDAVAGEAAEAGRRHAEVARSLVEKSGKHLIVSGGELTVTGAGKQGRGGPNLEYLAGVAQILEAGDPICALAGDSDGIDGSESNAGGFVAAGTIPQDRLRTALAEHDTYSLFESFGGLVFTGPTRTNVNDIRLIAVGEN